MPPKKPVAILNYHRVTDEHSSGSLFHDVTTARFRSQIALIAHRAIETDGPVHRLNNDRFVVLTFDDSFAEHLTVGTLLREHQLVGIFSVISGFLGKTGHLSVRDLKQLAALGHRIASHTVTHRPLPSLSNAELFTELGDSKAILEDLTGEAVDWLVPPGGLLCPRSVDVAMEVGFKVVRTMDWGYTSMPLAGVVACLPVLRHFSLRRFERLLDGHARIWLFHIKRHLKSTLGDQVFLACRNIVTGYRIGGILRPATPLQRRRRTKLNR
jgi:peptidoglycan/xylan/chitin deacetylase (PgdA/CDA1 family)